MKNPIPRNDMWATPQNIDEHYEFLERFSVADQLKKEEKVNEDV